MKISVYVCPTPGCGAYYGVNGMPDLHQQFSGARVEDRSRAIKDQGSPYRQSRAACPDCRTRGVSVERELVTVDVALPQSVTPTPALPAL